MPISPNIEVANDFFHDSQDLLHRYRLTADHFYAVKSKRLKLFLDLRMATECALKAYAAYFSMAGLTREEAIKQVEGYSHKIKKMAEAVKSSVEPAAWKEFTPYIEQLDRLPVGLRYRLDGADFREVNEPFYYETVGSDHWLESLYRVIEALTNELNQHLVGHSRIVSASEVFEELLKPSHNKYAKPRKSDAPDA